MSKVEHDPELVKRVLDAMASASSDPVGSACRAIDVMLAWQREHAEPSEADLIAELGGVERVRVYLSHDGSWAAFLYGPQSIVTPTFHGSTPRAALAQLLDAVKGKRK